MAGSGDRMEHAASMDADTPAVRRQECIVYDLQQQ